MTASVAKGKYVYYRCSSCGDRHDIKYYGEEDVGKRLFAAVKGIQPTEAEARELLTLIGEKSHERERHRLQEIERHRREVRILDQVRRRAYEEKLLDRLSDSDWQRMDKEWREKHEGHVHEMTLLEASVGPSVDDVQVTLEPLKDAPELTWRAITGCEQEWLGRVESAGVV